MSAKELLLSQHDLHTVLFNNVLKDISEDEAIIRLVPTINNIKWLAGHLVWGQTGLARMGSVKMEIKWIDHYNTQIPAPPGPEIAIPGLEEIKNAWNQYSSSICEGLKKLTDEMMDSPMEFPMPAFRTIGGLWAFINHHQAYTIGQIGILRRALGKDAMKYV